MIWRFVPGVGTSALALAAFLVVAEPAAAQRFGRGGGFQYRSSPWSGARGGYNTGYNSPYYGGYYGGGYYGTGNYNDGYGPTYRQDYGRSYAPATYGYESGYYPGTPPSSYGQDPRMAAQPAEDKTAVHFLVRVPADAEIWFDGAKTAQTGSVREFVCPALDNDRQCSYQIHARWTEDGRDVDRTRKVSFRAGDRVTVDFTKRPSQGADANEKHDESAHTSPASVEPGQPADRDQDLRRSRAPLTPTASFAVAADESTHDGQVVRTAAGKLVMSGKDNKEHSHTLAPNAQITCDNAVCTLADLAPGMRIRVTTKNDDKQLATRIEALDRNGDFQKRDK